MTLLAPNIVNAILDGRQPHHVMLAMLMRSFPSAWREQLRCERPSTSSLATNDGCPVTDDALSTNARWHAVVKYRTRVGRPLDVEMYLEEIGDIQDRIEHGPHWDSVEIVEIRRINHTDSLKLTPEQAEELSHRPIDEIS